MKIGITGTHGTGKTSLAHSLVGELKERGFQAAVTSEHERQCPLPVGTESRNSLEAQAWIIGRQFIEEIELAKKYPIVVCDRTMICNYAYFLWNLKRMPIMKDHPVVNTVEKIVDSWAKTYNYLFKVQIPPQKEKTLVEDGFRSASEHWQREIDEIIDTIINEKKLKVYKIELAPNRERVGDILKIMKL